MTVSSLDPIHRLVPFTKCGVRDDDLIRRGAGEPVIREGVLLLGPLLEIIQLPAEVLLNRYAGTKVLGLTADVSFELRVSVFGFILRSTLPPQAVQ